MKKKILSLILSISLIFNNQSINCFAETYGNETTIEELNQTLNNTFNDPNFQEQITKFIILRKIIKFGGSIAVAILSGFLGYTILRIIREQRYQSRNCLNTITKEKYSPIDTAISQPKIQAVKNSDFNAMNSLFKDFIEIKDTMEKEEIKKIASNTVNDIVNSAMNALYQKDLDDTLQANLNTLNNMKNLELNMFPQKYTPREIHLYELSKNLLSSIYELGMAVKKLGEEQKAFLELLKIIEQLYKD